MENNFLSKISSVIFIQIMIPSVVHLKRKPIHKLNVLFTAYMCRSTEFGLVNHKVFLIVKNVNAGLSMIITLWSGLQWYLVAIEVSLKN